MNSVFDAALEVSRFLDGKGWSFCILGGLAVSRWGQARATVDVDLSLLTGLGGEAPFIDALLSEFSPRRADARDFALLSRVLLLQSSSGVGIDVALAGFPFEERMLRRSSLYEFAPAIALRTISAEDLIVSKAFAGRPRDWSDIEGVIICQRRSLNWELIMAELGPLCELKEAPETIDQLLQIRNAVGGG